MSDTIDLGLLTRGIRIKVLRHALGLRQVDLASAARADTKDVRRCEADYFQGVSLAMIERIETYLATEAEARGILRRDKQLELTPGGHQA